MQSDRRSRPTEQFLSRSELRHPLSPLIFVRVADRREVLLILSWVLLCVTLVRDNTMATSDARSSSVSNPARLVERSAALLEQDVELAAAVEDERLGSAIQHARVAVVMVRRGPWDATGWPDRVRRGLGLLVLDGLLLRRVGIRGRGGAELLASGDLLRPWQREDSVASVPRKSGWQVLETARIAVLDIDFARRIANHPEIHGQLVARALRRSRQLAVNMAIVHHPRVETRVGMLLWHLADRWGVVRQDGVLVPLSLTHTVIGDLVAAQRPTVSAALGALQRQGCIARVAAGWLLHGSPPGELEELDALGRGVADDAVGAAGSSP